MKAVSLSDMMESKLEAFLDRKEIRDVFDMEFLLKRGVPLDASVDTLREVLRLIDALPRRDYTVKLSLEHNLPIADSIILATAKEFNAILWTQDSDFKNINDVEYFPKK